MPFERVDGVFLLDKPLHLSSNIALQKVRRLFNAKKAGHTGSLDPLATGMLPICFGYATKFSQFMLDADKGYTATGKLGTITATQDSEGDVLEQKPFEHITKAMLIEALAKFTGPIEQVPSMYSALKKDGVPLYKLARQGITIERKARSIVIRELELLEFDLPYFTIRVRCSKGTYIRNLVEDIGNYLQVGAFVSKLHRDFSCPFEGVPMYSLESLQEKGAASFNLHSMSLMVAHLPKILLNSEQQTTLFYGQIVELDQEIEQEKLYQLYNHDNEFIGLGQHNASNRLKAKRLVQPLV